jgi:hypothetical protein
MRFEELVLKLYPMKSQCMGQALLKIYIYTSADKKLYISKNQEVYNYENNISLLIKLRRVFSKNTFASCVWARDRAYRWRYDGVYDTNLRPVWLFQSQD